MQYKNFVLQNIDSLDVFNWLITLPLYLSFHLAIAVFRRAPKSFTDQRYYSWMAFEYKAKDGVPRYAKFRLVPADDREETGLMTEYDQRKPW